MYVLIDTESRNLLGEFENYVQAESVFLRYVKADMRAAHRLKIVEAGGNEAVVPAAAIAAAQRGRREGLDPRVVVG